jgi:hypothetical protein
MADDDNVLVGIKFLMGTAGDVSHGDELGSGKFRELEFPRLADVKQGEVFTLINENLYLLRCDFEVQKVISLI